MATIEKIIIREPFLTFEKFRHGLVALTFISSFFVKTEPAPTDLFGIIAILLFVGSGLHISRYFAAPLFFLVIYITGGIISIAAFAEPWPDDFEPYQYTIGIIYTAATGIFLAGYLSINTFERFYRIEKAYLIGAVIGAILGLLLLLRVEPFISIFLAIPGISWNDYYHRAVGGYKDPNVFSTWLVLPTVLMAHGFMTNRIRLTFISFVSFMLLLASLFFAFSRGAWLDVILSMGLMILLTVMLNPSSRQRIRIVTLTVVGIGILAVAIAGLLTIPAILEIFLDRFTFTKSYDAGETGRWANQINSIPYLLTHPFGYGPYFFDNVFNLAPHNTFLNSFAAAGWIGGFSYLTLFCINCYMGFKCVFTRSPFQSLAIPVVSTYIVMILQGIQIDNEHWRHLYWMMGMIWGLYAAMKEGEARGFTVQEVADGWGIADEFDDEDEDEDEYEYAYDRR